jgi:hypothetical protein
MFDDFHRQAVPAAITVNTVVGGSAISKCHRQETP